MPRPDWSSFHVPCRFPETQPLWWTIVFFLEFHRSPRTLVLPVSLGWQVDLCKSSCSRFPQIPQFFTKSNRLIHTTSFTLNLIFFLHFLLVMSQCSSISISQTNFLNYGRSLYSLPHFLFYHWINHYPASDYINLKQPIFALHLTLSAFCYKFFHMLLLCHIFL
jgi:hypothetical protein